MSLILAIEPDQGQAAKLADLIRGRLHAELVHAETTEAALEALVRIGDRVPDLVLVPSLLSAQEDAAIAGALRMIAAATNVRMITIPRLADRQQPAKSRGVFARLRGRPSKAAPGGCDPELFADQIAAYLAEVAAERKAQAEDEAFVTPFHAASPEVLVEESSSEEVVGTPEAFVAPAADIMPEPRVESYAAPTEIYEPIAVPAAEVASPATQWSVEPVSVILPEPEFERPIKPEPIETIAPPVAVVESFPHVIEPTVPTLAVEEPSLASAAHVESVHQYDEPAFEAAPAFDEAVAELPTAETPFAEQHIVEPSPIGRVVVPEAPDAIDELPLASYAAADVAKDRVFAIEREPVASPVDEASATFEELVLRAAAAVEKPVIAPYERDVPAVEFAEHGAHSAVDLDADRPASDVAAESWAEVPVEPHRSVAPPVDEAPPSRAKNRRVRRRKKPAPPPPAESDDPIDIDALIAPLLSEIAASRMKKSARLEPIEPPAPVAEAYRTPAPDAPPAAAVPPTTSPEPVGELAEETPLAASPEEAPVHAAALVPAEIEPVVTAAPLAAAPVVEEPIVSAPAAATPVTPESTAPTRVEAAPVVPVLPEPNVPAPATIVPVVPEPVVSAPMAAAPVAEPVVPTPIAVTTVAPEPSVDTRAEVAPTVPEPIAPVPVVSEPIVPMPIAAVPVVPEPLVATPVATVPVVPVVPEPIVPAPVAAAPVAAEPFVPAPIAAAPVAPEPLATPVATVPVVPEPIVPAPVAAAPVAPEPFVPAPAAAVPVAPKPTVATRPVTEPVQAVPAKIAGPPPLSPDLDVDPMFFAEDVHEDGRRDPAPHDRPAWIELIESLRQDIERLKSERGDTRRQATSVVVSPPPAPAEPAATPQPTSKIRRLPIPRVVPKEPKPIQDQWGLFDPEQCGFAALRAKLDEISARDEVSA